MAYETSDYKGDVEYDRNATGDCVVGDEICFERASFSGSYRNASFEGFERIKGKIIKDSYGRDRQQHTFTLALPDGSTMRIKGRNLYKNGVYRRSWDNELKRLEATEEKHTRGDRAREVREIRKMERGF